MGGKGKKVRWNSAGWSTGFLSALRLACAIHVCAQNMYHQGYVTRPQDGLSTMNGSANGQFVLSESLPLTREQV